MKPAGTRKLGFAIVLGGLLFGVFLEAVLVWRNAALENFVLSFAVVALICTLGLGFYSMADLEEVITNLKQVNSRLERIAELLEKRDGE